MTVEATGPIAEMEPLLAWIATASAIVAILILLWFLLRRPPLVPTVKILLLLGFGVFPILAAFTGNVASFEHSATRSFCGSCHVMEPWTDDAADPHSNTLSAIHARSPRFGAKNCYNCHADYGMFGTLLTKMGGMRHVYEYYTHYRTYTIEEALEGIHIRQPFSNDACLNCHSTRTPGWEGVEEHRSIAQEARSGEASCVSSGCHGPAHPFSKPDEEEAPAEAWGEPGGGADATAQPGDAAEVTP